MDIRLVNDSDYEMLCGWWKDWGWSQYPSKNMLPDIGVVVNEVAAGFLYLTNSKLAWANWIVTDKNYREDDRGDIINTVILSLEQIAKDNGVEVMYGVISSNSLVNRYVELGYNKGDYQQELVKII